MDITQWMEVFTEAVRHAFGERVRCIGLQGSRARGEAEADSDIDVVVILDEWRTSDWERYRMVLDHLPERERVCGFVSGWTELLGWESSELFGFYYDTRPWYGDLEPLRACFGREDACRAVRIGAGNIYHACAHNRLHAQDETVLRDLYKSAFFTLRAVHFCRTGMFIRTKRELLPLLKGAEHEILSAALQEPAGSFAEQSERLLDWAGGLLRTFVL